MAKQEYKILEFHGGTNSKFDARDIADNQNASSQLSIANPGRLTGEGAALSLYDKTDINGKSINDITGTGGFKAGYGLFSFSHDYDLEGDEIDTEFIVINDGADIDIYDPNQSTEWQEAKFTLGSRAATVRPEYYNVDGALRVCDSHFSKTDVGIDTDAVIEKNHVVLTTESGTIATGSIIKIEQEIMYVTSGSSSGTSITVIRGFANTKITRHLTNQDIYYVNVPKYFGHIKQDRLFECATSNSINAWVEDVQTPQPPNNTRKSDGTSGTLASSAGIQSLRIYDKITSSTTNIPTESEKVVLEFGENPGNVGITKILFGSYGDGNIKITTSGYGSDSTANHNLSEGDLINFSEMQGVASSLSGEHEVMSVIDATSFTIYVENASNETDLDYIPASGAGATSGDREAFSSSVSDWADYSDEDQAVDGLKIVIGTDADFTNTSSFPIHITGETGVTNYNGIYMAFRIDDNNAYISHADHGEHGDGSTDAKIQQLIGIIRHSEFEGVINEDLKRKWNFSMSFTYDGPAQEVQESLLTMGHKIEEAVQDDGTPNNLNDTTTSGGIDADDTPIEVKDSSTFSVNDVIMIGTEQMLVTEINPSGAANHIAVTRGHNNTTAGTHTDGASIFKITELTPTATVDWTNFVGVPKCVIKSVYGYGVDEKSWNARINGFKIYMKDVTDEDASKELRLFAHVNFNRGTYTIFAADDSELILEQPASNAIATLTTGTNIKMKPIDTYLSENMFTEQTIIDAEYKCAAVVGRKMYIGNIRQGGRTYPDRMLKSPVNKFDTFPETNYIDVAIGDGDSITALKSFGDRLLQFKKNKVYIINVGGESEFLEAEYNNAGCEFPSQIIKTNTGIAWLNKAGLWFFDGRELENLTKFTYDGSFAIGNTNLTSPKIGYDSINDRVIFAANIASSYVTVWYIYDLTLKAFQSAYLSQLFPFSANANYFTNMINDSDGDLVVGYVDGGSSTKTELNFYTWSNSDTGHQVYPNTSSLWLSKDIDFGSPGTRKKVYKVYITYKCSGHSGVKVEYSTDGGTSLSGFSTSTSTNYSIGSLENTNGAWAVAELKPSSSINNIKSMQLSFLLNPVTAGTAQSGSSSVIRLASSGPSDTDDAYNDYNIYIYDGAGRYNSRKILDYDGDGGETGAAHTVTFSTGSTALTDNGYGNAADSTSKYVVGSFDPDFEINDITIVYRAKRIK